ncbi:MAG: hypothetical protein J7639_14070 [Paenibacillaceae bacterium]|nr:hypothetical protein [Paenibacillaceae bacterium]
MGYRLSLLVFLLFISAALPGLTAAAASATQPVHFQDPVLEQAVRTQLQIADRELNADDLLKLTSFFPRPEEKITSLAGLEYAVNLISFYAPNQAISDLTPLSKLTKLGILALNDNEIVDACPLASLTKLHQLIVSRNRIAKLDCLSGLTNITDLLAGDNQLTSVELAKTMTKLRWLSVENNRIADLSPLSGLPALEHLYADHNRIVNVHPLLDAPELYDIHVNDNPLDEQAESDISTMRRHGASVNVTGSLPGKFTQTPVYLDGKRVFFDEQPMIENGTTLVQFRPLFETLGLALEWDSETQTIVGSKPGLTLRLQIGSNQATVNGATYELSEPPKLAGDYTFVPTRFIGESLGYDVTWDNSKGAVRIYSSLNTGYSYDGLNTIELSRKWQRLDKPTNSVIVFSAQTADKDMLYVVKETKRNLSYLPDLDEYWRNLVTIMKSSMPDYFRFNEPVRNEFGPWSGLQGAVYYSGEIGYVEQIVILESKTAYYRMMIISPADNEEAAKRELAAIVSTLRELERK